MKGKRMSALATASLMAMTALAAMPQPAMADEEKTVINIWSKDRHDADYVQKKIDEYNENNTDNIEVNYQLYTDNYTQAVDMAVQSGEMPDILVFQDQMFDKYIGEDQWADLYEFMDDDMKEMFKDVIHEGYNETGAPMGYDFEKGEYDFTTWADELKLWTELLSDECAFPGCESLDIDPLRTQFAAGKIGMYMSYSHAEPGVYANQFPMDSDKWDCAPIPTAGGKEVGKQYFSATSSYMLNAKSENLEKAYQVYHDIFTTEEYLIGYYEGGYGVSIIPAILEKAEPSDDFKNKEWLKINPETDALLPKPPHSAFTSGMIVEGEDMFKTCESIYYGGADIESTLQDLTDRYNKAYQEAIENGTGYEIKIENYDPMNPTLQ